MVVANEYMEAVRVFVTAVSCRHQWTDPASRYVSRIEYSEPDERGWQTMTLVDTREGQRCLRCGVMREDICDLPR